MGGHSSDGAKSGEIEVVTAAGKVELLAATKASQAYAQIGHGGASANGDLEGSIKVSGTGGVDVIGGLGLTELGAGQASYAQIGHRRRAFQWK